MAYTPAVDGTTVVNAASINDRFNQAYTDLESVTTCGNMLKNSSFETWGEAGAGTQPDAWKFTANDGVASPMAVTSTYNGTGSYICKIAKASGDSGISYLEQVLTPIFYEAESCAEEYFTLTAKLSSTVGSKARLYIDDGTKRYSSYATTSFTTVTLTQQIGAAPTKFVVGVECLAGDTYDTHIGDVCLVRGSIAPNYQPNQTDYSISCVDWDKDGTIYPVLGGIRMVPFELSGSLTGGGIYEIATYTVPAAMRPVSGLCAFVGLVSITVHANADINIAASWDSTSTPTQIKCYFQRCNANLSACTFTVRGIWFGMGWASSDVVFGGY